MPQYSWHDCPAPVRAQVERFVHAVQILLADQLVGVYLHGSLAMGCFNPSRSDLDLLVVTHAGMPAQIKRDLAQLLLEVSGAARTDRDQLPPARRHTPLAPPGPLRSAL